MSLDFAEFSIYKLLMLLYCLDKCRWWCQKMALFCILPYVKRNFALTFIYKLLFHGPCTDVTPGASSFIMAASKISYNDSYHPCKAALRSVPLWIRRTAHEFISMSSNLCSYLFSSASCSAHTRRAQLVLSHGSYFISLRMKCSRQNTPQFKVPSFVSM